MKGEEEGVSWGGGRRGARMPRLIDCLFSKTAEKEAAVRFSKPHGGGCAETHHEDTGKTGRDSKGPGTQA